MIEEIKIYLMVLSCLFTLRYVIGILGKMYQEEPEPIQISNTKQILLYGAVSYIITFIII